MMRCGEAFATSVFEIMLLFLMFLFAVKIIKPDKYLRSKQKEVFLTWIHNFWREKTEKIEQKDNIAFYKWNVLLEFPRRHQQLFKVSVIKSWYSEYCRQVFILWGHSAAIIFQSLISFVILI